MRFWHFLALSVMLIALAGCKSDSAAKDEHGHPIETPKTGANKPENIRQLKELKVTDVVPGKGPGAAFGDLLVISYRGSLKDGTEFDSNQKEGGVPYNVLLGNQEVIPGWEQGLVGMKVGGTRKLEVPNKLAYGDESRGENVPAGADLYFEVKLLDMVKMGEEGLYDKSDVKVGSGRAVKVGDRVEVNYRLTLANGKVVDEHMDKMSPVVFRVGPKRQEDDRLVPAGVSSAILGMKEGGIRKMRIPPAIGYANHLAAGIPPNSVVRIEMHLLKIQ